MAAHSDGDGPPDWTDLVGTNDPHLLAAPITTLEVCSFLSLERTNDNKPHQYH
jgi:hypothetical protein